MPTVSDELRVLAEEQAALRRVATLVARGVAAGELFTAVTEEVGRVLSAEDVHLIRYEPDDTATVLATFGTGDILPAGTRLKLGGKNVATVVFETGRSAPIDDYGDVSGAFGVSARERGIRSAVGTPIVLEAGLWGVMVVGCAEEQSLPADTEARLASFTELVATAITIAESRAELTRLAEQQAALRRVATLVARGALPEQVFAAVVDEVGQLFPVDYAGMARYDPDSLVTAVAARGTTHFPVGSSLSLGGKNLATLVFETGRPVRIDGYADASGPMGDTARERGVHSSVAAPIIVEGRLWGLIGAGSTGEQPLPADTEARLADFMELVETAIANAESRAALAASRARIVAAADEARRRIERDLHDGTQQRLVSLGLAARNVEATVPPDRSDLRAGLSDIATGLRDAVTELQELSRGIHPAILSEGGISPALRGLARRSAIPVELDVTADTRLPEPIEVATYFVVSEALANATKHAQASRIDVSVAVSNGGLLLSIRDDGVGGADPARGSGLVGLTDRVEALGGSLHVQSRQGDGTHITAELPLELQLPKGPG